MPAESDFTSRGKVSAVESGHVVFCPAGTNYQIKAVTPAPYVGPTSQSVDVTLHGSGRKILTVSTGGNFVAPIFGPPRIVQGRIKWMDQSTIVVHAGPTFHIALPAADSALDLSAGGLAVGAMVNVTLMPGALLKLVPALVVQK